MALRVTPANNCFRRETMVDLPQEVWDHTMMSPANLLGIALLDEEYKLLPGYDIVVDVATRLGVQRDGYGTTYTGEPTFMDYVSIQIFSSSSCESLLTTNTLSILTAFIHIE